MQKVLKGSKAQQKKNKEREKIRGLSGAKLEHVDICGPAHDPRVPNPPTANTLGAGIEQANTAYMEHRKKLEVEGEHDRRRPKGQHIDDMIIRNFDNGTMISSISISFRNRY